MECEDGVHIKPIKFRLSALTFASSLTPYSILLSSFFLAYLLADAGYDVWLANARGTEPSRAHVRVSASGWNQKDYWSFEYAYLFSQ